MSYNFAATAFGKMSFFGGTITRLLLALWNVRRHFLSPTTSTSQQIDGNQAGLEPDDFLFDSMERTEDILRYIPGGYHPVIIGDILGGTSSQVTEKYHIMHKLGYGGFGTVWLAQTTDPSRQLVAVKVTTARDGWERETNILQELSKRPHPNILALLDHFSLDGPNGRHSVLVTDVVVPLLSVSRKYGLWLKAVAYGLAKGLAHLHTDGIVHGDLHLGNVGLAIPQLIKRKADDVITRHIPAHEVTLVLTANPIHQTSSLPAYLVVPAVLNNFYYQLVDSELPQPKILDFGSAHKVGANVSHRECALEACPPEVAFARVVDKIENPAYNPPGDVWALGAAIYKLMTRSSLFDCGLQELPSSMLSLVRADGLSPAWQSWKDSQVFPFLVRPYESWWDHCRNNIAKGCTDARDADQLVGLLKKMLVLDPDRRVTASDVVQDPWFADLTATN